jgi:hypothetical protein
VSQRRGIGGARHEATERVVLRREGGDAAAHAAAEGWTLNVSRGGLRVVVEEPIVAGLDYRVAVGEGAARLARAVWVREEADGRIVGLQFLDLDVPGSVPPPADSPPADS